MGLRDSMNRLAAEQQEKNQASREAAAATVAGCPNAAEHYVTEVNKGSIRMQTWQAALTSKYRQGYRLAHVFEQDGNTVQVFEHHHP